MMEQTESHCSDSVGAASSFEVAIVYRMLPHYRVGFYEGLRARLESEGGSFRLLYGPPDPQHALRKDTSDLQWAEPTTSRFFHIGGRILVWQQCLRSVRSCDLVIVEHASRNLVNYPLLVWRRFGGPRVAWWGHGRNLDRDSASRFSENLKRRLARRADWWFCYTEGSARIVEECGVPRDRMTVVQNAIDTEGISRDRSELSGEQLAAARAELGIGDGPVGVYVGSLYGTKRIPYLIEASDQIRSVFSGFHLIVIGDGPERSWLEDAASNRPWVHVLGMRTGAEMVRYAALGSVMLNPGLVGLSVLDAFALGLPMVTCDQPYHSPEIEYLADGENGLVLAADTSAAEYGDCVVALLNDSRRLERLSAEASSSSNRYTVEEMVDRFAAGILKALQVAK